MIKRTRNIGMVVLALIALGQAFPARAADVGTAFTYQGKLTSAGAPANGPFDFQFRLFTGEFPFGFLTAGPITIEDVQVTDGLFTVRLDFGAALNGSARWLDVSVRPGASVGTYTILQPRQELTPAPYAIGLSLPYTTTFSSASTLFSLNQSGAGKTMLLTSTTADCLEAACTGTGDAVYARNSGSGLAVGAYTTGAGNALYGQATGGGTAVYGYNLGTSGRAGFFRTEQSNNTSHTVEVQANGTGHAVKANARVGSAGYFENTNASSTTSTVRVETNGQALGLWSRTTGTSSAARVEVANSSNNAPALDVKTSGTGLAAKFTGGNVEVGGELYATIGTVKNRATPIAFGRFDGFNSLQSSGNVTVTYESANDRYKIFVVGEGDPEKWIIMTSIDYYDISGDLEYIAKASRPLSVAGQPGNGVFYIRDVCKNGCEQFQVNHWVDFVVYKGV